MAHPNPDHLSSERITQDVLLTAGEHDRFQPLTSARAQAAALTSARSVTMRVFTAAEYADQHCQMGNLGLACDCPHELVASQPASERP